MGFSTGASVVISHHFGAKDDQRTRRSIHTSIVVTVLIGLILTVIGLIISPLLVRFMKTPDEIAPGAILYLRMITPFAFLICFTQMFSGTLRSIGDAKAPMIIMLQKGLFRKFCN